MTVHSGRRLATPFFTSRRLLALAAAAGLGTAPLADARAQHAGHGGHQGHHGSGAKANPPAKKPGKRRGLSSAGKPLPRTASATIDPPAVSEFKTAHASMMSGMSVPYTGDPDADFRIQMIPHHQGAIDMAKVAMRHARDPWTRQLAEAVIVEQQREIAEMQAWLAQRGIPAPDVARSMHRLTANSFRQRSEEPGTRDEARGQSWAPGAGIPAVR